MSDSHSQKMILAGFIQASNCSNYTGSWRHPETDHGFLSPEYYQSIARTLESSKFHLAFIDDRLAMPSQYGNSFLDSVNHGIRSVKLDLVPVMTAMGLATSNLGIGGTYSTTYHHPYHVARLFATVDHMTGGRSALNVVTSLNDAEAQNFGLLEHSDHDVRYDQAEEFMEIATALWDSWESDALIVDSGSGQFADGDKVKAIDYDGMWFKSRGPLTVPHCPQGKPVIIQAGQSPRGREFAAKWAELIFVIFPSLEANKRFYTDIKRKIFSYGRDPQKVLVAPAIYVVVGDTDEDAFDKFQEIKKLAKTVDSLTLLSEVFNYDFSQHSIDEPLSDEDLESISGLRGFLDRVIGLSGTNNPTVQDFITYSGRGTLDELPTFVGSPSSVADNMQDWFQNGACDGFVIAATHMPGAYEDFCSMVVPELQERGVFQDDYRGSTLRDNLGIL